MKSTRDKLLEQGYSFEFFQAVKLLEDANPNAPSVGGLGPVSEEVIRIRPNKDLAFPPGDVQRIDRKVVNHGEDNERETFEVFENFMGLYGASSPLPPFVADMIAQNYSDEDPLRDFLDIFNHRALSLRYKGWKKHCLAAMFRSDFDDPATMVFCALLGYDKLAPREEWVIPPERLIPYAGRLAGGSQSVSGLEVVVSDFFAVEDVRVQQFLPRRIKLTENDQNRLGAPGQNCKLGDNLVLGDELHDVCGQFRLSIGGLTFEEFKKFQPGEPAFKELVFLVRLYTRNQLGFEIELHLQREAAGSMLVSSMIERNALGRSSWLGAGDLDKAAVRLSPEAGYLETGPARAGTRVLLKKRRESYDMEFTLKNSIHEMGKIHDAVEVFADKHQLSAKLAFNFGLILEELLVNTISYGFDDEQEHEIHIRMWADRGWFRVQIEDEGRTFNPLCDSPEPMIDLSVQDRPIGGVGIHLTKELMDDVKYQRINGKNIVTLAKKRDSSQTQQTVKK